MHDDEEIGDDSHAQIETEGFEGREEPAEGSYTIGHKKPPKSGQFTKGHKRSKGRPKGSKNIRTIVEQELLGTLTYTEGGKKKSGTKLGIILRTQTNKAMQSDSKAAAFVFGVAGKYLPQPEPEGESVELSAAERAVLGDYLKMKELFEGRQADD